MLSISLSPAFLSGELMSVPPPPLLRRCALPLTRLLFDPGAFAPAPPSPSDSSSSSSSPSNSSPSSPESPWKSARCHDACAAWIRYLASHLFILPFF